MECFLFLVLVASLAAHAACPNELRSTDVASALDTAEAAYANLEESGLLAAMERAHQSIPCVVDPISPSLAARYHRMVGVQRGTSLNDADGSKVAFAAARWIEPARELSWELAPKGHPLRSYYGAINLEDASFDDVEAPRYGRVYFDGKPGTKRPQDWPTIVQLFGEDGAVSETVLLAPGDSMPRYELMPDTVDVPKSGPTARQRPNRPLLIAGLATGALAGGALAFAAQRRGAYNSAAMEVGDRSRLDATRAQTNTASTVSVALGGAAVLVTGLSFVIPGKAK